jgi:hypothetical protein
MNLFIKLLVVGSVILAMLNVWAELWDKGTYFMACAVFLQQLIRPASK